MNFDKLQITKTRYIDSINLNVWEQSYKWLFYYKIDGKPAKISIERRLGNERMSIGFIKAEQLHQFVLDAA